MKLIPIQSSMLSHAGYDEKNHELGVVFIDGGLYIYENVPRSTYSGLMEADAAGDSVGAYMHKYVIDKYNYRRMNQVGGASPKEHSGSPPTKRSSHETAPKPHPKAGFQRGRSFNSDTNATLRGSNSQSPRTTEIQK